MTFRTHNESGDTYEFEVVDWSHGERIAYAPIREPGEKYGINLERHVFDIQHSADDATQVRLTAVASTAGIRGRFIGLLFWPGYQKQSLNDALEALAAALEPPGEHPDKPVSDE